MGRREQKLEKNLRQAEERLAQDLGVASVPAMQLLDMATGGAPRGSLLPRTEIVPSRFGRVSVLSGGTLPFGAVRFGYINVTAPRPLEMQLFAVSVSQSMSVPGGVFATSVALAVPLRKPVAGPVRLGDQSVFEGDATTAALLNSDPDLLKAASRLPVTRASTGKMVGKINRHLVIQPLPDGQAVLTLRTLPDILMTRTGYRAGKALEFAAALEARL
ncbi:hypothetical protein [Actinoallomurus sp. CA-150999]|uniref:hypothetical protein n=1 Tax=Actinoallomurus sp. CA-150999 TaxID=3239887 RepID=UPI003D9046C5